MEWKEDWEGWTGTTGFRNLEHVRVAGADLVREDQNESSTKK